MRLLQAQKAMPLDPFFVSLPQNKSSIMIVTNQATDTKRNATSTRNRIMASTMSVDEYFDELIDKVREDYANSERLLAEHDKTKAQKAVVKDSLTRAFDELHSGKVHHDARKLFAE